MSSDTPKLTRVRAKPTSEEIAKLREERERKRQAVARAAEETRTTGDGNPLLALADDPRGQVVEREWIPLTEPTGMCSQRTIIKTWNLLAQALVRRKMFPTSDCLKSAEREHMLYRELIHPKADIICLQEVDRLDKIRPYLEAMGYDMVYASGPNKKHGCMIAFLREKYAKVDEHVVHMDIAAAGATFKTKNIGSLVALREQGIAEKGIVVATTHLFWHPSYTYERTRQAGILLQETAKFRDTIGQRTWPCVMAGDFNFAPDDAAYSLLVGVPLSPKHIGMLARSRVVHASMDPSVPITTRKMIGNTEGNSSTAAETTGDSSRPVREEAEEDEEGGGGTDPDRAITNAREARPEDGLLTTPELRQLYEQAGAPVRSMCDEAQRLYKSAVTCGPRLELPAERLGSYEPEWTSYTHYWKTVLDYIFLLDSSTSNTKAQVLGYFKPPTTQELHPGIPMKGVTSSDHVSLTVELAWL